MTYDHFRDIIGTIVVILFIAAGIFSVINGSLIIGWVWIICGSGILIIAGYDMWRRYK